MVTIIFQMENSSYIIKKQFLDASKYEQLLTHTYEYEDLFKTWLGQITDFYRASQKPQQFSPHSHVSTLEITKEGLQNLVYPFISKLYEISTEHLIYVSSIMRQSTTFSFDKDISRILDKVKAFNDCEHHFSNTYRELLSAEHRVALEPTHNLEFYYYSNWFKRLSALEKYTKSIKVLQDSKPNKQKLYQAAEDIQQQLLQIRKRIMDYKYGYLKQGVKLSRQLLKCLSEYLAVGIQILSKINGKIKIELASDNPNPRGLRYSESSLGETDHMYQFRQNYERKAEAFRDTLSNIQKLFIFTDSIVDKKKLFTTYAQMYAGNEHLLTEMFDVYNLFETMSKNRQIINERLSLILNKIDTEHKSKKKAAEVLNTLTKRRQMEDEKNLSSSLEASRGRLSHSQQFDIKNILKSVSDSIEFSLKCFAQLSEMCYRYSIKATEQKHIENNMEISYQYKEIKIKARRPCQEEVWLWKDWREFKVFPQIVPKYDQKLISKQLSEIKKFLQEGDDSSEKISCFIEGRSRGKATLEIFPEKIQVISKKQANANFILPYKYIEYVEPKKKGLIIKMQGGAEMNLSDFKNVVEVQKKINEYFLSEEPNQNKKNTLLPAKPAVVITNEELDSIQKRGSEMAKVKPDLSQYKKYAETTINGISAQQVYQSIFSDLNSCPLSKNASFFQFVNEKSGNFNVVSSKYDKEGPYFYTQNNKEVTFVNCPLSSVRVTQLDHPLPPIPFLPKKIHCKSEETIFWISNKELQYKADVSSFGNKLMQSLYTSTFYSVKQDDGNVKIEIWCKIWFKKDATMKSILENGAIGEIKNIVPEMMKNIEKCCRLAIKARSREGNATDENKKAEENIEEQQVEVREGKSGEREQKQQSKINRTIILLVVGTILINIIINLVL